MMACKVIQNNEKKYGKQKECCYIRNSNRAMLMELATGAVNPTSGSTLTWHQQQKHNAMQNAGAAGLIEGVQNYDITKN
ncbi:hypothetical protein [Franconibacter helveticus]|uniref:hypothetical protein n=2 Tax=Franconibacter helveticus TaxID=357240 RepID=UPI0013A618D2|nr:hypothetical protein [Franconibacter helveticus]